MKYKTEELVPIVAKLAEGYTSKESTSITYERAQQFMEAVLYSMQEAEKAEQFSLAQKDALFSEQIYAIGAKCVEEKTKETLYLYNEIMAHFSSYGNLCLKDTVAKGMPEFFKWYDCKYEPQNTILTLDYPIFADLSESTGIDKIHDYLICIQLEQKFLNRFSSEYIIEILEKYDKQYKFMIENICEIVLMNIISHILAEKQMSDLAFEPEDYLKIQTLIQKEELNGLREKLKEAIQLFIREYYENDEKLMEYLFIAVNNISVRMKTAAECGESRSERYSKGEMEL